MSIPTLILFAIAGCLLVLLLKQYQKPQGILLACLVCCMMLLAFLPELEEIIGTATDFFTQSPMQTESLTLLCKAIGISYLAQIGMDICQDCGEHAIRSAIEICCRLCLTALSLPLFQALAATILEVIG